MKKEEPLPVKQAPAKNKFEDDDESDDFSQIKKPAPVTKPAPAKTVKISDDSEEEFKPPTKPAQ